MAFNDSIGGSDVAALIPEETSNEIISGVEVKSAAMNLMRRTRMSSSTQKMAVLSALPEAFFVASGGGLKQTSKLAWDKKYLNAEEIAVIVPIPESYLDDSQFDIWAESRPKIEEAIAIAIDKAVLFGINKPDTWGTAVYDHAVAAGNQLLRGSVGGQDVAGDVSDIMSLVEEDGYDVTGHAARKRMKGAFRNLRDDNGQPIFQANLQDSTKGMLWGEQLNYVSNSGWDSSKADLITGDWMQAIIAMRQDITWKLLTEATIFDDEGNVLFNLAQQDMVAMRIVIRLAYQIANSVNREGDIATQSPFAVLHPVGYTAP